MGFWIHMAAARHPDRVAIESGERTVTYAELSALAVQGARGLSARGTDGRGERVALEIADRLEFALALHACLLSGTAAVPIDTRLSDRERAVRTAGAKTVVTGPLYPSSAYLFPAVAGPGMLDMVATVMHTSGTTSAPKPVELTYGNWLANAFASAVALGLNPAERWLCTMPLTHVGGLSILIRSAIYATTVMLHERFDAEAVRDALMDPAQRITMVSVVPTMLSRLLDAGLREPPTLRWALLGGGPAAPALMTRAQAAGVPVAPTYGMTEACSQIATFGLPLRGVDLRASGPEQEIWVRGPMVAPGALAADGWLHTGDLGRFDEHGRLEIVGRKSDTIITGGENVAPIEVEAALLEHPAVADAAVFGRVDPQWGEAVTAKVVLREGVGASAGELREHCAARLARFKVPKQVELVASLPRGATGKLLRRELAGPDDGGRAGDVAP